MRDGCVSVLCQKVSAIPLTKVKLPQGVQFPMGGGKVGEVHIVLSCLLGELKGGESKRVDRVCVCVCMG